MEPLKTYQASSAKLANVSNQLAALVLSSNRMIAAMERLEQQVRSVASSHDSVMSSDYLVLGHMTTMDAPAFVDSQSIMHGTTAAESTLMENLTSIVYGIASSRLKVREIVPRFGGSRKANSNKHDPLRTKLAICQHGYLDEYIMAEPIWLNILKRLNVNDRMSLKLGTMYT